LFLNACSNRNEPANAQSTAQPSTDAQTAPQASERRDGIDNNETGADNPASGELTITLDYERISGHASNQYAVWFEDMDGNYINTVYATGWTAKGGFKTRPDSIKLWVEKSGIAAMPDYYIDAVSGATPKSGTQTYTWNLRDINGEEVPAGEYKFFVEGTLRWKNYVLYSGVISIGGAPATVQAEAEFVYEASGEQAALTETSPENSMLKSVTASYVPSAN
jgi:hypothetical protein